MKSINLGTNSFSCNKMLKNQKSKNEYSISETKRYTCLHKMDSSSNLKATMV
jgi:hypothetical protein